MKPHIRLPKLMRLALLLLLTLGFASCTSDKLRESTDETLNITSYLRANEEYSLFLKILERTNYDDFMNTYGTYTFFLPTNGAVNEYLKEIGVNSLDDLSNDQVLNIAKLHILDSKAAITTATFTDGKLSEPSLSGQYLVTTAKSVDGVTSYTVNKIARIARPNVVVGNGVIHVIDKVLRLAQKTMAQTIEEDPTLSLFTEALKITGWYNELNKPLTYDAVTKKPSFATVLAQTNAVFNAAGINSIEDLKAKYSHTKDPLNPKDSLNLFVAYRIIPSLQYLADISLTQTLETKAPLEIISVKFDKDNLLLNEDIFNGKLEPGVSFNRALSESTCSNGVVHQVNTNFFIKKRSAAPVYFDLADQPEFRKLTSIFRKVGKWYSLFDDDLADVSWDPVSAATLINNPSGYAITYTCGAKTTQPYHGLAWHGDNLEIYRFRNDFVQNLVFKTPVIVKGRYKVWMSYRQVGSKVPTIRVYLDGVLLSRGVNLSKGGTATGGTTGTTPEILEAQGQKNCYTTYSSSYNSTLCGVIDVAFTGRHSLRLEATVVTAGNNSWIDLVEFRPIEMDQLWPKFESGGDRLQGKDGKYY